MKDEYNPDYVSPPGDTLKETLETIGMTPEELAARMGILKEQLYAIIKGDCIIDGEIAYALQKILKIPATFWLNREKRYSRFKRQEREEKTQT